jgi:hypothetical protein
MSSSEIIHYNRRMIVAVIIVQVLCAALPRMCY